MKKLISLLLLLPVLALAQTLPRYVNTTNGVAYTPSTPGGGGVATTNDLNAAYTSGRAIYVSPWGNDTLADGSFFNPFRTVHNPLEISDAAPTWEGANTIAEAGDTIVFTPDIHYQGVIPLKDDVNLWIMPGASVIHAGFSNTTVFGTPQYAPATLTTAGPMIQPGHNSVIDFRGANLTATNNAGDGYDAAFGWVEGLPTSQFLFFLSLTNASKTNVTVLAGNGFGTTDYFYFVQTNTEPSSVSIYGGKSRSGWDTIRGTGNLHLNTFNMDIFSTNTHSIPTEENSRGVALSGGVTWRDTGSSISSGGGTVINQAVSLGGAGTTAILDMTSAFNTSSGTPVVAADSATYSGAHLEEHILTGDGSGLTDIPPTTGIDGWPANSAGFLENDGAGNLSWGSASSGITIYGGVGTNNVFYYASAADQPGEKIVDFAEGLAYAPLAGSFKWIDWREGEMFDPTDGSVALTTYNRTLVGSWNATDLSGSLLWYTDRVVATNAADASSTVMYGTGALDVTNGWDAGVIHSMTATNGGLALTNGTGRVNINTVAGGNLYIVSSSTAGFRVGPSTTAYVFAGENSNGGWLNTSNTRLQLGAGSGNGAITLFDSGGVTIGNFPRTDSGAQNLRVEGIIFGNGIGITNAIGAQLTRSLPAQLDKTDDTLTQCGFGIYVTNGVTYEFCARLNASLDATGGGKVAMGGVTATTVSYRVTSFAAASARITSTRQSSIGSAVTSTAGLTDEYYIIEGTITPSATGIFGPQFAQASANGTSSILVSSTFWVKRINQ